MTYLDPDVVVTWQNGEVSRKPDGVKAYYDRMMKGPQRVVDTLTIDPTVEELTHLYGDTGVAFGSSKDHYKLADGKDFDLLSHWTATVVKKDGKWKIAAFHASANMFDNAVLRLAVFRVSSWTGGIALVAGIVVGVVLGKVFRKRSPAISSRECAADRRFTARTGWLKPNSNPTDIHQNAKFRCIRRMK